MNLGFIELTTASGGEKVSVAYSHIVFMFDSKYGGAVVRLVNDSELHVKECICQIKSKIQVVMEG